jgi:hypothetical protein
MPEVECRVLNGSDMSDAAGCAGRGNGLDDHLSDEAFQGYRLLGQYFTLPKDQ